MFRKLITRELGKLGKTFEYRKFLVIALRDSINPQTKEHVDKLFEFVHVYYPSFVKPDANGVC